MERNALNSDGDDYDDATCADGADLEYDAVGSQLFANVDDVPAGCTDFCAPRICAEICITFGDTADHRGFVSQRPAEDTSVIRCFCLFDNGQAPTDVSGWSLPTGVASAGGSFESLELGDGDGPILNTNPDGSDVDRCFERIPVSAASVCSTLFWTSQITSTYLTFPRSRLLQI